MERTMRIVTSNPDKLAEFRRFGLALEAEAGADLPEVDGTPEEVALHKALAAGPGRIVEDTSLDVGGVDVGVNVRWLIGRIGEHAGRRATWRVLLAANDGGRVRVYEGAVTGTLVNPTRLPADAFGFDPYFLPDGCRFTLAELAARGEKDRHSARLRAVEALLADRPKEVHDADAVPPWRGGWQHG